MNFTITNLPKSEVEIEITIPFSEFEPHVKKAAVLISEKIEIEGFRKGRAPYDVMKNKVGEAAIYEEAAELAVRRTYPEVMTGIKNKELGISEDFTPIGRPEITITKLAPGNELVFKIKVALLPKISLPDYKAIAQKIRAKKEESAVGDEETDKTIRWLCDARTQLVTVARPAQKGDRVEVDFEIRHGGVKIEGGESQNHPLVLGEGRFLPGFEDELAGLKAGQKKEFTLTAPEDWRDKAFAGKALDFSARMNLVQERKIPELTDEFAKGLGDFASAEALKQNVREGLLREKKEKETQRVRALIMEEIAERAEIEVPNVLVAGETEKMLAELKSGAEQMGMQWADYLAHVKKTPEELQNGWQGEAEKRVRIALCLGEIARQEKIKPAEEEITARANQFLAQYQSPDETAKNIDAKQLKEYARGILKNEKVFEFLETV
ncbi:MAG: trigger factor [Patescibacteria group bacterium]